MTTIADFAQAFGESIGAKRGGNAKIVGRVVAAPQGKSDSRPSGQKWWDEIACAHCASARWRRPLTQPDPSPIHFADMAASEDYQVRVTAADGRSRRQDVNHRFRVPVRTAWSTPR